MCPFGRSPFGPVPLTREARRDILLRGLGNSGLSICSFCRNSGGRRMSMGSERRLLTSCREGTQDKARDIPNRTPALPARGEVTASGPQAPPAPSTCLHGEAALAVVAVAHGRHRGPALPLRRGLGAAVSCQVPARLRQLQLPLGQLWGQKGSRVSGRSGGRGARSGGGQGGSGDAGISASLSVSPGNSAFCSTFPGPHHPQHSQSPPCHEGL